MASEGEPPMVIKRGQAMIELAVGMFALILVVSALASFTFYIVRGLELERHVRADAGKDAIQFSDLSDNPAYRFANRVDSVEVDSVSAKYFFGRSKVEVQEAVYLPPMMGL